MKYSKSTGGFYVDEIHGENIPTDAIDITGEYHTELLVGQSAGKVIIADDNGFPNLQNPPLLTLEQLRKTMIVSAAQARINLARKGMLKAVNAVIMSLEEDSEIRILWEFETVLHRNNAVLNEFCATHLDINDEEIDALFERPLN